MKNSVLTIGLSLLSCISLAQESDDTTRINLGDKTVIIVSDELDTNYIEFNSNDNEPDADDYARWSGFYLGANGLLTPDNSTTLPEEAEFLDIDYTKSFTAQLNLFEYRVNLGTPHVGLTTGFGFEFNRYDMKRNNRLMYNSDSVWGAIDTTVSFDKNFLKTTYIQAPLLLEFNTSKDPDKGLYVAAGVVAGYNIAAKTKYKYELNGDKNKDIVKGHYNINPFKLSATARIGFRNVTLFANYGLTSLFEKSRAPEVNTFSAGIILLPF